MTSIQVTLSDVNMGALQKAHDTGLFGRTLEDTAALLLLERMMELMQDGLRLRDSEKRG